MVDACLSKAQYVISEITEMPVLRFQDIPVNASARVHLCFKNFTQNSPLSWCRPLFVYDRGWPSTASGIQVAYFNQDEGSMPVLYNSELLYNMFTGIRWGAERSKRYTIYNCAGGRDKWRLSVIGALKDPTVNLNHGHGDDEKLVYRY